MSASRSMFRRLLLAVVPLLVVAAPSAASAQQMGRVIPGGLGRAQLDLPGITMVEVGSFGAGLERLEATRPEVAPLASRFRMQRRTGIVLGLVALAGGAVALHRFSDTDRPALELGDPESTVLVGALGAMTLSVIQLRAADRTLRVLAGGFGRDGRFIEGAP